MIKTEKEKERKRVKEKEREKERKCSKMIGIFWMRATYNSLLFITFFFHDAFRDAKTQNVKGVRQKIISHIVST